MLDAGNAARSQPRWSRDDGAAPVDLDAEVCALASASGPLRRALARIAGRMVAARSWERLGFARLSDYAAERAGISARELRDLAHVDRALEALPQLERAFVAGELGWTQLRLLCRVAQPADEREWLALASQLTASALAREVRRVDRCAREEIGQADPDEGRRVGVFVRCTPEVRARWWHARQVANRVAGHTLSMGEFAEVLTAEVVSAVGVDGPPLEDTQSAQRASETHAAEEGAASKQVPRYGSVRCGVPRGAVTRTPHPDAAPQFIAALTRDLDSADAFELDARLRRALRLEARRLARLSEQLERVVVLGIHRAIGFASLDGYAVEHLGMAPSRARALLRVARASAQCDALRTAFAAGRLSWVQAHALVPLLLEPAARPHGGAWVRRAERVSVRRLCDDVEAALATGAWAPPAHPTDLQIGAIASSRTAQDTTAPRAQIFFAASPEVVHLFRAALATVQRRLEHLLRRPVSPSRALEEMLAHALATWVAHDPHADGPRYRRVFERDGWRCTVPGCSSYRNLHGHHIVFRSRRGSNALANLTTLCAWHHQRGVHGSGPVISCTGRAPHALRFALGLRPGNPPLLAYGPGEVRM